MYNTSVPAGNIAGDIACKYKGNSGRKGYDKGQLTLKLQEVSAIQRSTSRATALSIDASIGVIQRLLASHHVAERTTTIKPVLTEANKLRRVQYALSFVADDARQHGDTFGHAFDPMLNIVHVDEKWFNRDKKTRRFNLVKGEEAPQRRRHSARHIQKTMFLTAIARPRWDPHRKTEFDGKLGLWPFAEDYITKRKSKNRPAGTKLKKNIESVNSEVYKHFLLEFVFAAIRKKWPRGDRGRIIYVQQDNATPHVSPRDPDILREAKSDGWDIRLIFQPANSPDFNCLDLGYFSAIQSLQYQTYIASTEQLIEVVEASFRNLDKQKLDNIFLTLQQVMECVLACKGGNAYKLPHLGKAKLLRQRRLHRYIVCDAAVFEAANAMDTFCQSYYTPL
ncbi:unnamed protein product [Phytophthora fragariaefolia]|uniref:Unnamed protein product n=1 Tax=Phytophthora fragariaefolia TaxID=1490495 RepID=A0A9W6XE67_9STRA|nr:unnamed protein product [Phytophthora fragariaefolia]